jgi:hypothetical protein
MRALAAALTAVSLCAIPSACAAHTGGAARSGPYALELLDASGRPLPTFRHRGRTYVLGALGARYQLRIRNGSSERVEAVASVDGRDVLDGKPASVGRRGYLVPARGELVVDGFRLDAASVAAFRFAPVPRSYAALAGDDRDVGVVGVAIFRERPRAVVALPRSEAREIGAERQPPSSPAIADGGGSAPRRPTPERPGLGTEFGERRSSPVEEVAFERAPGGSAAILDLRYDDRAGLAALGIDLDGAWARRGEGERRALAEPFRAGPGYAEPPPGWRP